MNHYTFLGVSKNATDEQIKSAYRALALKWHPDRNPENLEEATRQFKLASEAFEVLTDPNKKWQYDQQGYVGRRPPPRPAPPKPPPPPPKPKKDSFFDPEPHGYTPPTQSELEALNCSFIDGGSTGRSVVTHLHVDPIVLEQGGDTKMKIKRRMSCRACAGDGYMMTACPRCGGRRGPEDNMGVPTWACETCEGDGAVKVKCKHCHGEGVHLWEIVEVRVRIPSRSKVGYSVLLYGEGESAPQKAPGNVRVILV